MQSWLSEFYDPLMTDSIPVGFYDQIPTLPLPDKLFRLVQDTARRERESDFEETVVSPSPEHWEPSVSPPSPSPPKGKRKGIRRSGKNGASSCGICAEHGCTVVALCLHCLTVSHLCLCLLQIVIQDPREQKRRSDLFASLAPITVRRSEDFEVFSFHIYFKYIIHILLIPYFFKLFEVA